MALSITFKYVHVLRVSSYVEVDGRLVRVLHFLDTQRGARSDGVVDIRQVGLSWTLSHSAELVVHRAVAEADPSLVGSDVRSWDAAEMSADSRADEHLGVAAVGQVSWRRLLVESGGLWKSVSFSHFGLRQPSNEDGLSVPGGLQHFTWRQLRDV